MTVIPVASATPVAVTVVPLVPESDTLLGSPLTHEIARATGLPPASFGVAVSTMVPATPIVVVTGETSTDTTATSATLTPSVPVFPWAAAVIVAAPAVLAVTVPEEFTLATAVSLLVQRNVTPDTALPLAVRAMAVSWRTSPTVKLVLPVTVIVAMPFEGPVLPPPPPHAASAAGRMMSMATRLAKRMGDSRGGCVGRSGKMSGGGFVVYTERARSARPFAPCGPARHLSSMDFLAILLAVKGNPLLHALDSAWGYLAIAASVILFEETTPVLAGFTAHQEHLHVWRLGLVCAFGGWFATLVPYAIGRYGASRLLARFPAAEATMLRLMGVAARRPWRAALASRFVFGARTLLPLACGTAKVRMIPFVAGSAISSAAWAALYTWLGWISGETVLLILGRAKRHELSVWLAFALILLLVLWVIQRRNRSHVAAELEKTDDILRLTGSHPTSGKGE